MAHCEQILRKLLEQIAIERSLVNYNITTKQIFSGGANYTSQLFLATITSDNEDNLYLFGKVAALGDKMRSEVPFCVYEVERKVYTGLAKKFELLEDKHNVPNEHRLKMPKFYACNPNIKEETIVLEDLTKQGFGDYSRFKSIDWQYASKVVEELAKLHALSFAYAHEDPDEFEQLVKELNVDWQSQEEQRKLFWENMLLAGIAATKEENRDRVKEFIAKLNVTEKFEEFLQPTGSYTLTHRDFRVSNIMHKINNDGTLDVRVIDYQTIQGGSPIVDLLYFIFTGSDEEFRSKYYEQLMEHYYTQLKMSMERLNLNTEKIYSKEIFELELKQKLPYALAIAIFLLPLVTVEAKNAPKVDENMDIASFKIDNVSELFPERLNGIVNDFIRWKLL